MAWQFLPGGFTPQQPQGFQPAFPQQGQAAQRVGQYRQAVHTPTPNFFGPGRSAPSAPGQAAPAPPISANSIWSDQQLQEQLNLRRAENERALQSRYKQMDQRNASRGMAPGSYSADRDKDRLWAQMMARTAADENQFRFGTAQQRAQHLLNTQQAQSGQHFQGLEDERARYGLGLQGWQTANDVGFREANLAAQLGDAEAQRQHQVGLSGLQHGQDVYRQLLGQGGEMDRLRASLASAERLQGERLGFEGQQGDKERDLRAALQSQQLRSESERLAQQLGFQGQEGMAERQLRAGLQTQALGAQQQAQIRELDAQMGRLQAQLQATQQGSREENQLRWALAGLQNQRDIVLQGMSGQQALQQEQLRQRGAFGLEGLRQQGSQWQQAFGTAADFEKLRLQAEQEEWMARLGNRLGENTWRRQQDVGFQRDIGTRQWDDLFRRRAVGDQAQWENWGQAQQFGRQYPLLLSADMRAWHPFTEAGQAQRREDTFWGEAMKSLGTRWPMIDHHTQTRALWNALMQASQVGQRPPQAWTPYYAQQMFHQGPLGWQNIMQEGG